jgi:hypothetical protein
VQQGSRRPAEPQEIVVDHVSAHGPSVTHIRGLILTKSIENLTQAGLSERYLRELPSDLHETMRFVIASSWVPIELARAHYEACDRMKLGDRTTEELGELMAASMSGTLFASLLRTTRSAGMESLWTALRQNDRLWDRMYQGGGVTVIKLGPKDLILENHGISLAESRHFRAAYRAYWLALGRLFAKAVFVKLVAPREAHPHRIALAGSWV